jgi:hypothetical protein
MNSNSLNCELTITSGAPKARACGHVIKPHLAAWRVPVNAHDAPLFELGTSWLRRVDGAGEPYHGQIPRTAFESRPGLACF